MINKKEFIVIILSTIILAFSISLMRTLNIFLYTSLMIFLIFIINILAKKIASHYLESQIEIKLWEISRFGFRPNSRFKRPKPAGLILPLISTILSSGYFVWMACFTFDVKSKVHRAAKRYGLYKFSEISEYHTGIIAAIGIAANLLFAIIGYLMGFPTFSKLNIWFTFFNMIPISNLDGNKIFFGSITLWSFLSAIVLIALGYVFLLI